jgi:AraC family transcriptional regulator
METPKKVVVPAKLIVGMAMDCKSNQYNPIPELWDRFIPRFDEIANRVDTDVCYGLCCNHEAPRESEWEYTAGFEVRDATSVPDGMVIRTIPAGTYLVFTHHGELSNLMNTFSYISKQYLPSSPYKAAGMEFELYDDRFDPNDQEHSAIDIYVAVTDR